MSQNVSQLIQDVSRKVSPANPVDSRDIMGAVADAARRVSANVSFKDLSRRVEVENALYDQVFRFACPADLDQQMIMQWYKMNQNGRNTDTFYHPMRQVTNRDFDRYRGSNNQSGRNDLNIFTVEYQSGVKFLKVSDFHCDTGVTIHKMESITENGTWNVFGNVVNLTTDNLNYVAGNGSLRFDINDSSNTGGIENFTLTPIDLSEYFVTGKIFSWLDIPNLNQIQTVTLDLHSSATDYYSITVSQPHDTTAFQLDWNLLGFPFDSRYMTINGTPNPAIINQIKITFVTNGTLLMNSVRMDNLVARQGSAYGIQYISEWFFHDAVSGLWKENPTEGSDIIHLSSNAYNLLLDETAVIVGQELFTGKGSTHDLTRLEDIRTRNLKIYRQKNKEEFIDIQQQFYNFGLPFGNGYYDNSNRQSRPDNWFEQQQ
jgi:hypothetical protein